MIKGYGWLPDLPDPRDYSPDHAKLRFMNLKQESVPTGFPSIVDRRADCTPIRNQGNLGSCTAFAGVGLYEYTVKRAFKQIVSLSPMFLYKTTRRLMGVTGDTGAWLRTTMGALTLFGTPPEKFWNYDVNSFEKEPDAWLYSYAQSFQAVNYFRLDKGVTGTALLDRIKSYLHRGYASMFGFTVFSSIVEADNTGFIPFPSSKESVEGGHAIVAVGYDDRVEIKGAMNRGALIIRNSWGTSWGDRGYGWLPYDYVLQGLADDFWSITKAEWVETGQFDE